MLFFSRRTLLWACVLTFFCAESASAQYFNFLKAGSNSPRVLAARRQQIGSMIQDARADGEIDRKEKQSIIHFARLTLPEEEAKALVDRLNGVQQPVQQPVVQATAPERPRVPSAAKPASPLIATSYAQGEASTEESPASRPGKLLPSPVGDPTPLSTSLENGSLSPTQQTGDDIGLGSGCDSCCDVGCDGGDCCDCGSCCSMMGCLVQSRSPWDNLKLFSSLDAFKGPMDLGNRNANFGIRFGANLGIPIWPTRNIGFQIGTTETVADFNGTEYTSDTCRWQNFTTIAFYRRNPCGPGHFNWGFGHDWLNDHYYRSMKLRQWRIKTSYNWGCSDEIGLWTSIPESVADAQLPRPDQGTYVTQFKALAQGNFFWTHYWDRGASTTGWLGIAEDPGGLVLGVKGEVPISERLAVFGKCQYIAPRSSGVDGQDKDFYYLTIGIQFTPGRCGNLGRPTDYAPFLPVADNGSFSVREF